MRGLLTIINHTQPAEEWQVGVWLTDQAHSHRPATEAEVKQYAPEMLWLPHTIVLGGNSNNVVIQDSFVEEAAGLLAGQREPRLNHYLVYIEQYKGYRLASVINNPAPLAMIQVLFESYNRCGLLKTPFDASCKLNWLTDSSLFVAAADFDSAVGHLLEVQGSSEQQTSYKDALRVVYWPEYADEQHKAFPAINDDDLEFSFQIVRHDKFNVVNINKHSRPASRSNGIYFDTENSGIVVAESLMDAESKWIEMGYEVMMNLSGEMTLANINQANIRGADQ